MGVEENEGVAIFLYTFLGKMGESVEENEGVAIFLPFFDKNVIFPVEENRGVAIFLPFFGEISIFVVEENRGVAIFLPFFDNNVIFPVEENTGVPVFLYTSAQSPQRSPAKRSRPAASDENHAVSASARRIGGKQMRPLQGRFLIEEKAEGSRVQPDFLFFWYFIWKGSRRLPHRYSMR